MSKTYAPRAVYLCNVFDDTVRANRKVETYSAAASAKVFRTSAAVRRSGIDTWVLSMGRGRQRNSGNWFRPVVRRNGSVPIVYAAFWDFPILTHFVTAISIAALLFRLRRRCQSAIFYNHLPHYLAALFLARVLGITRILDLEDGIAAGGGRLRLLLEKALLRVYDASSNGGAMLANSQLTKQVNCSPTYINYGVAPMVICEKSWDGPVQVLLAGTLMEETGARFFLDALRLMKQRRPFVLEQCSITVTGSGPMAADIEHASRNELKGALEFKGLIQWTEYKKILLRANVGLSLKVPGTEIGDTTFPSKVIEYAGHGLLVVSTRVSDVPTIFTDSSALLLEAPTVEALCDNLTEIVSSRGASAEVALRGQTRMRELLSAEVVGPKMASFWCNKDIGPGLDLFLDPRVANQENPRR